MDIRSSNFINLEKVEYYLFPYLCPTCTKSNPDLEYRESAEKWTKGKLNKAFLDFYQLFGIFADFSKFCSGFVMLYCSTPGCGYPIRH